MARPWLCFLPLLAVFACGTDAVGVDACRQVEYARCEAATHCGLVKDIDDCQRFYRDHCLHGVRLEEAPRAVDVNNCVDVIEAAGRCARAEDGAETRLDQCGDDLASANARRVCDIVLEPERAPDCAFLDVEREPEPEPEPEPDAG